MDAKESAAFTLGAVLATAALAGVFTNLWDSLFAFTVWAILAMSALSDRENREDRGD